MLGVGVLVIHDARQLSVDAFASDAAPYCSRRLPSVPGFFTRQFVVTRARERAAQTRARRPVGKAPRAGSLRAPRTRAPTLSSEAPADQRQQPERAEGRPALIAARDRTPAIIIINDRG